MRITACTILLGLGLLRGVSAQETAAGEATDGGVGSTTRSPSLTVASPATSAGGAAALSAAPGAPAAPGTGPASKGPLLRRAAWAGLARPVGTAPVAIGPTAPSVDHPGILPGEAYTFRFSVGPIEGARARMSIGLPVVKDGRSLVAVQGEAETLSLVRLVAPMNAAYVLTLDLGTLLPREVISSEKGLHNLRFHSLLDGRALDLEIASPQRTQRQHRVLPREARDPLSAYFALRAHTLAPGTTLGFDVLDGAALWRVSLSVQPAEDLHLDERSPNPPPAVRAIRLEGSLQRIDDSGNPLPRPAPRKISLWLSDDPARVLLRASFDSDLGRAVLELSSYVPPRRPARAQRSSLPGLDPG